jgi:hypothetical protein
LCQSHFQRPLAGWQATIEGYLASHCIAVGASLLFTDVRRFESLAGPPRYGHRLATVVAAGVCAVVAGLPLVRRDRRVVADLPAQAAARLGIRADRRPSEAMIRRLLQTLDADRLTTVIAGWLAEHRAQPAADGTLPANRGSGSTARSAWFVRGGGFGSDRVAGAVRYAR